MAKLNEAKTKTYSKCEAGVLSSVNCTASPMLLAKWSTLMATTATATTGSAGRRLRGRGGRSTVSVSVGRAEYRKLNGVLFSRALGTGNFLILIQDDSFERGCTIVANVFVNGHSAISTLVETTGDGRGFPKLLTPPGTLRWRLRRSQTI